MALAILASTYPFVAIFVDPSLSSGVGDVGSPENAGLTVPAFPLNCPWRLLVAPARYPSSVAVTLAAPTFPAASERSARFAMRSADTMVLAPPMMDALARAFVK